VAEANRFGGRRQATAALEPVLHPRPPASHPSRPTCAAVRVSGPSGR